MRYDCESCDACGGRVGVPWWADPRAYWLDVYEELLGFRPRIADGIAGGLLCLPCFARGARALGRACTAHVIPIRDHDGCPSMSDIVDRQVREM
jgi:hypothetical protein